MNGITKIADVKDLVRLATDEPVSSFPAIKKLAASDDWKEREVGASVILEIGKKKPDVIISEMLVWAGSSDPNIRRCASEGLRGVARKNPEPVFPVLARLNADPNIYVKKSVANVLRNAGNYHAQKVLDICKEWATEGNPNTNWIIKDGLRKLQLKYPNEVGAILSSLE